VRGKPFLVYAIVLSLAEQAVLLFVLLWLLPRVGLEVPAWAVVLLAASLAAYSVVLTRLNYRALNQIPIQSPAIGAHGRVVQTLNPRGYVKLGNELWSAEVEGRHLVQGEEVVVLRVAGLLLTVAPVEMSDEVPNQGRTH
jgi:membrane protein implicated in regulation of membrane protease activity